MATFDLLIKMFITEYAGFPGRRQALPVAQAAEGTAKTALSGNQLVTHGELVLREGQSLSFTFMGGMQQKEKNKEVKVPLAGDRLQLKSTLLCLSRSRVSSGKQGRSSTGQRF